MENAQAFMAKVAESPELQAKLESLNGRNAIEQLCKIAADLGFEFGEDDYRAAVVEEADGGLSEEAIDEAVKEWGFPAEDE